MRLAHETAPLAWTGRKSDRATDEAANIQPRTGRAPRVSIESTLVRKGLFALAKTMSSPRATLSWVVRGHLAKVRHGVRPELFLHHVQIARATEVGVERAVAETQHFGGRQMFCR